VEGELSAAEGLGTRGFNVPWSYVEEIESVLYYIAGKPSKKESEDILYDFRVVLY
jgi:hypothetical protein